jgi:hypothetical protein
LDGHYTPDALRLTLLVDFAATFLPEMFDPFLEFLPGFFEECPGSFGYDTIPLRQ